MRIFRHVNIFLVATFFLFFFTNTFGQRGSFSISVDKDTMYQDEVVKVEVLIENVDGKYSAPDLSDFQIVGGPNTSSNYTIINGEVSQKRTYTYLLLPSGAGKLTIGAAKLQTQDNNMETEPIQIIVLQGSGVSSKSGKLTYKSDEIIGKDTSTQKTTANKRVLKKI